MCVYNRFIIHVSHVMFLYTLSKEAFLVYKKHCLSSDAVVADHESTQTDKNISRLTYLNDDVADVNFIGTKVGRFKSTAPGAGRPELLTGHIRCVVDRILFVCFRCLHSCNILSAPLTQIYISFVATFES